MTETSETNAADLAIVVDRLSFRAWTEGMLLDRGASGTCVVGDNVDHERAEDLLYEGKAIGLLVKGKLWSTMRYNNETRQCEERVV